jgi:dTDP-4-dehydrorhamnose 3,5-epimerase/CDP-3, 6-dideoxy-D-glycero-D-glycero-4-hexulose-5-epimerase
MINSTKTSIDGLLILSNPLFIDNRGSFKKVFTETEFKTLSLENNFSELYYSISNKNVIRGMHFQIPPYDHIKMVYVIQGRILDVCLDLRKKSLTYGQYFSYELLGDSEDYVYIPKGIAHGFLSLEDNTIVHYAQTACYSKEHDCGVRYDSFGFDWGIQSPVLSTRDRTFPSLNNFKPIF